MSDQLLWQILKGHNSFVRKGLNGMVLSAEPGNLYNKHSYKYSGAACAAVGCNHDYVMLSTHSSILFI